MPIMMKFLDKISFLRNEDKELAEKLGLKFSVRMNRLFDIWLKKGKTGENISWQNPDFANQKGIGYSRGGEGDEIFVKFSPEGNERITCTLRLSDIQYYSCWTSAGMYQNNKESAGYHEGTGNGCWLCLYEVVETDEDIDYRYALDVRFELLHVQMNEIVVFEIQV